MWGGQASSAPGDNSHTNRWSSSEGRGFKALTVYTKENCLRFVNPICLSLKLAELGEKKTPALFQNKRWQGLSSQVLFLGLETFQVSELSSNRSSWHQHNALERPVYLCPVSHLRIVTRRYLDEREGWGNGWTFCLFLWPSLLFSAGASWIQVGVFLGGVVGTTLTYTICFSFSSRITWVLARYMLVQSKYISQHSLQLDVAIRPSFSQWRSVQQLPGTSLER